MPDINDLRKKRAALVDEARALNDKAKEESRDFTEDEQKRWNEIEAELDKIREQIETEERALARQQRIVAEMQDLQLPQNDPVQPPIGDDGGNGGATRTRVEFPQGEPAWRSLGEFLVAVKRASDPTMRHDPLVQKLVKYNERAASGLSEGVPSDGGFLVQQDFAEELLKNVYKTGVLASRVRRIPISNPRSNGLKIYGIDETSRADGSRWGGVVAYWTSEAEAKTKSKPKFREINLKLNKLTGLCYATDELLEDAAALETIIRQAFRDEFGFKMDDGILNGTGAGQPLGILQSNAVVTVAKESGQAAQTIVAENILKMWSRCFGRSRPNAVWLINQDIEPQLYSLSLKIGTGGVPLYMPANGLAGQPWSTLFGRPVIPVEHCQTLGTKGDIVLADLSQYVMIDKGAPRSAASIHVRFLYDETVYRFVYRVDGQPIWSAPLTPYKGSNTLSPFVTLATRS